MRSKDAENRKKEKDVVRRTGIGWVCYFVMAIPFFALEIFLLTLVTTGDYGIYHTKEEILAFIIEELSSVSGSILGLIGLGFVILGVILKFVFYFPAKKHFEDYEDIKVSLF